MSSLSTIHRQLSSVNCPLMKHIVIFGAGKSSSALIAYLVDQLPANNWTLTVLDANKAVAVSKVGHSPLAKGESVNVENTKDRQHWVQQADIVISLLPPSLHFLVAGDCLLFKKNLLTASYVDDQLRSLEEQINKADILFLCETGLDPGIDHMSAMKLIDHIHEHEGSIHSFRSHCGGLVAPESDDNPWHYKISWNPKNIVLAGKAGAIFKENNTVQQLQYDELFNADNMVNVPGLGSLSWYANRDSMSYIDMYSLHHTETFIRTTLRHPHFLSGWKEIVTHGLTDENKLIDTDGLSIAAFFKMFFTEDIQEGIFREQLNFIGYSETQTLINKGKCSPAAVLQFLLEKYLVLNAGDHDMIVMLHEITYLNKGKKNIIESSLIVKGDDNTHTAMAKTVGLPLGIAAKLILQGKLNVKGLHIPVIPEIYNPVMEELAALGIAFREKHIVI